MTVDEVVSEAEVAKGTFYTHFNDLNELAAAVADELIKSFDELIQPFRLSFSDPLLRIEFGCDAFFQNCSMTACGHHLQAGWQGHTRRWGE